jgi:FkbM family methyltransferase
MHEKKCGVTSLVKIAHFFSTHPLTREAPLKAWARFLSWQIRSRMQEEVIVPWIAGQRLAIRRGMKGATGNIYVGLHEFSDMMFVLHFLREGDLFLDIGANVGSYAVLASGVCRATTWAFEPDPNTVRGLKRNVAINDLDELVTVYELALGGSEGEVPFTIGQDTGNRVAGFSEKNVRIVRQQRLDALIGGASQPILMIKLDVEGYEEEVLRGAQALLANDRLKIIDLEWPSSSIRDALSSHNFTTAYYEPFGRKLQRVPGGTFPSPNSLFVRDWEFVNSRLAAANKIKVLSHSI